MTPFPSSAPSVAVCPITFHAQAISTRQLSSVEFFLTNPSVPSASVCALQCAHNTLCQSAVFNHDTRTCALSQQNWHNHCKGSKERFKTFHLSADGADALSLITCIEQCGAIGGTRANEKEGNDIAHLLNILRARGAIDGGLRYAPTNGMISAMAADQISSHQMRSIEPEKVPTQREKTKQLADQQQFPLPEFSLAARWTAHSRPKHNGSFCRTEEEEMCRRQTKVSAIGRTVFWVPSDNLHQMQQKLEMLLMDAVNKEEKAMPQRTVQWKTNGIGVQAENGDGKGNGPTVPSKPTSQLSSSSLASSIASSSVLLPPSNYSVHGNDPSGKNELINKGSDYQEQQNDTNFIKLLKPEGVIEMTSVETETSSGGTSIRLLGSDRDKLRTSQMRPKQMNQTANANDHSNPIGISNGNDVVHSLSHQRLFHGQNGVPSAEQKTVVINGQIVSPQQLDVLANDQLNAAANKSSAAVDRADSVAEISAKKIHHNTEAEQGYVKLITLHGVSGEQSAAPSKGNAAFAPNVTESDEVTGKTAESTGGGGAIVCYRRIRRQQLDGAAAAAAFATLDGITLNECRCACAHTWDDATFEQGQSEDNGGFADNEIGPAATVGEGRRCRSLQYTQMDGEKGGGGRGKCTLNSADQQQHSAQFRLIPSSTDRSDFHYVSCAVKYLLKTAEKMCRGMDKQKMKLSGEETANLSATTDLDPSSSPINTSPSSSSSSLATSALTDQEASSLSSLSPTDQTPPSSSSSFATSASTDQDASSSSLLSTSASSDQDASSLLATSASTGQEAPSSLAVSASTDQEASSLSTSSPTDQTPFSSSSSSLAPSALFDQDASSSSSSSPSTSALSDQDASSSSSHSPTITLLSSSSLLTSASSDQDASSSYSPSVTPSSSPSSPPPSSPLTSSLSTLASTDPTEASSPSLPLASSPSPSSPSSSSSSPTLSSSSIPSSSSPSSAVTSSTDLSSLINANRHVNGCFEHIAGFAMRGTAAGLERAVTLEQCECLCANSLVSRLFAFQCVSATYYQSDQDCVLNLESRHSSPSHFGKAAGDDELETDDANVSVTYIGMVCPVEKAVDQLTADNGNARGDGGRRHCAALIAERQANKTASSAPVLKTGFPQGKEGGSSLIAPSAASSALRSDQCFREQPNYVLEGMALAVETNVTADQCKCFCAEAELRYGAICQSIQFYYGPMTCLLNKENRLSDPLKHFNFDAQGNIGTKYRAILDNRCGEAERRNDLANYLVWAHFAVGGDGTTMRRQRRQLKVLKKKVAKEEEEQKVGASGGAKKSGKSKNIGILSSSVLRRWSSSRKRTAPSQRHTQQQRHHGRRQSFEMTVDRCATAGNHCGIRVDCADARLVEPADKIGPAELQKQHSNQLAAPAAALEAEEELPSWTLSPPGGVFLPWVVTVVVGGTLMAGLKQQQTVVRDCAATMRHPIERVQQAGTGPLPLTAT
ncbi:hypothetical protein niasHT_022828 [Heterodera trifolii]|uniref:Apple domain-containing protein n=1 Tax=Heterodera trifolii TaxID=157864 RepID=A0ABD2JKU4_9BILA